MRMGFLRLCTAVLLLGSCAAFGQAQEDEESQAHAYDVVVYGGTAGGAVAAIAAAREGLRVALIEPGQHIGGMVSGGLGATDFGKKHVIGGMALEFFERVGKRYHEPVSWYFEPHVAEETFRTWLDEYHVNVFFGMRIKYVWKTAACITGIRMESGHWYKANVFIDASYEGDLMQRAKIPYTVGRESRREYGESLAGRIEYSKEHQFPVPISPYDENGNLLPLVNPPDAIEPGLGDRKVQAYNFRLCLCNRADNRVPFPQPEGYDPKRYELLRRYLEACPGLKMEELMTLSPMPNDKTDTNNKGPFSTDFIGGSWGYPDADHENRDKIRAEHKRYIQGFLYFLANDPSVPKALQEEVNQWGLAKDEFVDTGNWPHQMYIREARRMKGNYVMQQKDLQTERTKPDSIGMGSYNSDSHHVQRIAVKAGEKWSGGQEQPAIPGWPPDAQGVLNEGDMQVPVEPYEIAYRAICPKREDCENLLVPVCFSATHVAYSSMRMEPQYMIMGHAAGVAAAQALESGKPVQAIDVARFQALLKEQRQVLSLADAIPEDKDPAKFAGIVLDNHQAVISGRWVSSGAASGFVGSDYLHDADEEKGQKSVRFIPKLPKSGKYEVRISYAPNSNRATNVPVMIETTEGIKKVEVDQSKPLPNGESFVTLGVFPLGKETYVEVGTEGTAGHVSADAVQWLPVE